MIGWLPRARARRRLEREKRERQAIHEKREKELHAIWWNGERERLLARWKRGAVHHSICVMRKPKGRVFVDSYFEIANGPTTIDGPPIVLHSMDDAGQLGEAVLEGLAKSFRRILPQRNLRTDPPHLDFPLERKAKTWSEYRRHATVVRVDADYEERIGAVTLTPYHNMGRSASQPITDAKFTIKFEGPEQLGWAVQDAMARATTV